MRPPVAYVTGSSSGPGGTVPMQVVSVLARHACPFSGPVVGTASRVTHLCHRGKEAMLEVHARDPEEVDRIVRAYTAAGGRVMHRDPGANAALVRFPTCACCRAGQVIPSIEHQRYLYLPPSSYSAVGERYQFLVPEERFDPRLGERLPRGVEIVGVGTRPLSSLGFEGAYLVPIGSLVEQLTPRQRDAIVTATLRGYYRIPRAITTAELARTFQVSRPAFESLLRKAENKLVTALFPYLTGPAPSGADPPS